MATLKVIVVCGFGLGSSEILVINVQRALKSLGIKDFHVEASSLALSSALDADLIVTSGIFVKDIQSRLKGKNVPIIAIKSFVNLEEITEKLKDVLKGLNAFKK